MPHATHCCAIHGCKYGKDDCPVVNRNVMQVYACEDCEDLPAPKTQHDLKVDPEQFLQLMNGTKRHEVRDTTDRSFEVGDQLFLHEFIRETQQYTGEIVCFSVSNITSGGTYGLPEKICVMSLAN